MIDIKKLIEDYLGSPAPKDWNKNPNYRISLYDAEQLIQQVLQKTTCTTNVCQHENVDRKDGLDECLDCGARNY